MRSPMPTRTRRLLSGGARVSWRIARHAGAGARIAAAGLGAVALALGGIVGLRLVPAAGPRLAPVPPVRTASPAGELFGPRLARAPGLPHPGAGRRPAGRPWRTAEPARPAAGALTRCLAEDPQRAVAGLLTGSWPSLAGHLLADGKDNWACWSGGLVRGDLEAPGWRGFRAGGGARLAQRPLPTVTKAAGDAEWLGAGDQTRTRLEIGEP